MFYLLNYDMIRWKRGDRMEFQTLNKSHIKRNIIIGVVVVAIISACILTFTRAKYRTTQSIPLVNGTINYTLADLNIVAIYVDNEEVETLPSGNYELTSESYCTVNNERDDSINLSYDNNTQTLSVSPMENKGTKCYLYFEEQLCPEGASACNTILANSTRGSGTPNFANTSCSNGTNNGSNCDEATVGLYEGEENGETIYYFRGDVDDNWVSFAGFYWRIIRTNSDGSIRMIYAGTDPNTTTGESTQVEAYLFNASHNASYYVGLKYSNNQHGITTNSNIMDALNGWYSNNLANYADKLTSGTGFCNDRVSYSNTNGTIPLWSATESTLYYAAYVRLVTNAMPTLDCDIESDNFTTIESNIGNKALQYPIGLITADEASLAGAAYNKANYSYYLYTNRDYLTMTPSYFQSGTANNGNAIVFYVGASGPLGNSLVYTVGNGARPVINLRADVTLSGSGTSSDPYVVS